MGIFNSINNNLYFKFMAKFARLTDTEEGNVVVNMDKISSMRLDENGNTELFVYSISTEKSEDEGIFDEVPTTVEKCMFVVEESIDDILAVV